MGRGAGARRGPWIGGCEWGEQRDDHGGRCPSREIASNGCWALVRRGRRQLLLLHRSSCAPLSLSLDLTIRLWVTQANRNSHVRLDADSHDGAHVVEAVPPQSLGALPQALSRCPEASEGWGPRWDDPSAERGHDRHPRPHTGRSCSAPWGDFTRVDGLCSGRPCRGNSVGQRKGAGGPAQTDDLRLFLCDCVEPGYVSRSTTPGGDRRHAAPVPPVHRLGLRCVLRGMVPSGQSTHPIASLYSLGGIDRQTLRRIRRPRLTTCLRCDIMSPHRLHCLAQGIGAARRLGDVVAVVAALASISHRRNRHRQLPLELLPDDRGRGRSARR